MSTVSRRRFVVVTLVAAGIVPVLTVEPGKPSVTALEVTAYRAIGAVCRISQTARGYGRAVCFWPS
jgi:hypothetical protein